MSLRGSTIHSKNCAYMYYIAMYYISYIFFSEMKLNLDSVVFPDGTSITRGYEDFIAMTVTISNVDPTYDVPVYSGQNFNITSLCSDGSSRKRRSVLVDDYSGDSSAPGDETIHRVKRSTMEVGPFIAKDDDGSLGSGVVRGESISLNLTMGILLPRDTCASLTEICFSVEPATGGSYSLAPGDSHIQCLDLNVLKNCEGENCYDCDILTHWGRDKMADISHTTFSNGFSWMKMCKFRLRFHWNVFPGVQLTMF